PGTKVIGWDSVPSAYRPPVVWLIHLCFDVMVGLAFLLLLAGLWAQFEWWRGRRPPPPRLVLWGRAGSGVAAARGLGWARGGARSWPWNAAGWSPRPAGSPGWSTGCRPPPRRPPPTAA